MNYPFQKYYIRTVKAVKNILKSFNKRISALNLMVPVRTKAQLSKQYADPLSIPILIINFNQLHYLEEQVNFWLSRHFKNIVIIDNHSTYPPLLKYYDEIDNRVTIERLNENVGHMAFFDTAYLKEKYGKGFFVITDADIIPNKELPADFMTVLLRHLLKYSDKVTKVGFALDISDIPNQYPLKEKVVKWENQFWREAISENVYKAWIDTTFAVYKPAYSYTGKSDFLKALRIGGSFVAKHGGWYVDPRNLTEEQKYYLQSVNASSSWRIDENGTHRSTEYDTHIN